MGRWSVVLLVIVGVVALIANVIVLARVGAPSALIFASGFIAGVVALLLYAVGASTRKGNW